MHQKGMSRYDIAAAIRNKGVTLSELSRRISPSKASTVVSVAFAKPWPRVEREIAKFLGMKPEDIWPDRYDRNGQPLSKNSPKTSTAKKRSRRQKSKAA